MNKYSRYYVRINNYYRFSDGNPINLEETKKWRIYFPMNG